MKAFAKNLEFNIHLSDDEIDNLKSNSLLGRLRQRSGSEMSPRSLDVEIAVSDFKDSYNAYVTLKWEPKDADYSSTKKYLLEISQEGYSFLKSNGFVDDRFMNTARLLVHKENWRGY